MSCGLYKYNLTFSSKQSKQWVWRKKKKKKQSILWCHDLNLIMSLSQRSKVRRNLQDKWPEFFQRLNGVKNRGKQKYSGWERTETIQPMQWVDLSLFRIKDQPHWKKKRGHFKKFWENLKLVFIVIMGYGCVECLFFLGNANWSV